MLLPVVFLRPCSRIFWRYLTLGSYRRKLYRQRVKRLKITGPGRFETYVTCNGSLELKNLKIDKKNLIWKFLADFNHFAIFKSCNDFVVQDLVDTCRCSEMSPIFVPNRYRNEQTPYLKTYIFFSFGGLKNCLGIIPHGREALWLAIFRV